MFEYGDILLIFNIITCGVSLIGTLLFICWWIVMRKATAVYIYVLFLFFAIGVENLIEFMFRYEHYAFVKAHAISGCEFCTELVGPYWELRGALVLVVTVVFVSHMAMRIYSSVFKINKVKNEIKRFYDPDSSFHVMIVEDNPSIPVVLYDYIKKKCRGANVIVKSSAEAAIKHLDANNPVNMIICDINLRGHLTGFDLVKHAREYYPWIVNIGITGYPGRYTLHDARKFGFDDYFIKPFRLEDISKAMNYHRNKMQRWGLTANRKES